LTITVIDCLVILLYAAFVLGIGYALKSRVKTGKDFFQAGRSLPAWICGLALISVSMSAQEVIGLGAAGARYGLKAFQFYELGAIPAMLFVGLYMMPLYYGSKARSVPEFLRMRFDEKTGALNAGLFAVMMVLSSGITMYLMARLMQSLHLFDRTLYALRLSAGYILPISIVLPALIVGAYVWLGGLRSSIYNQALQFFLLIACLLPVVVLGLHSAGGWTGVLATLPTGQLLAWRGVSHTNPTGIESLGIGVSLGIVLNSGYWCTDFRVIQMAMAARNMNSARRAPLIAAIASVFLPLLVIVPGLVAIGLPTPHSTTTTHVVNGAIFRETTVVSQQVEQGSGLIPAKVDATTGKPMLTASGQPLLDYEMATPYMLQHFLPTGILGLGVTALLASFMSGMAGNVTAFNTVFTYDLYEAYIHKGASDRHYLAVGRWATVGGIFLSIAAAYAAIHFNNFLGSLQLVFSIVNAPLLATLLLGMFWKRATGHGAFVGLICGTAAAMLHHGLSLPIEVKPGVHGGWIAVLHHYPSDMAQNFWGAIFAFSTNFILTIVVSMMTKPKPESALVGLVRSLTPKPPHVHAKWWRRPEALAAAILLVAVAVNIFLA